LSAGIGSPVTSDSSTAPCPSTPAIDRNPLARTDAHPVADRDRFDVDLPFHAVADHPRGGRLQVEELAHALRSLGTDQQGNVAGQQVIGGQENDHGEKIDRWKTVQSAPMEKR